MNNTIIQNKNYIIALCEEAEKLNIDIAPDYMPDYVGLAFALSYEMGEEGREIFHRFCRLSSKYDEKNAEKNFTYCLKRTNGKVTIGSIVYLCRTHGIDTDAVHQRLVEQAEIEAKGSSYRDNGTAGQRLSSGKYEPGGSPEQDASEVTSNADPEIPLPTFGAHDLPFPLDRIYARGQTEAQCDALLLSALTVIGATLDYHVRTKYSDDFQYPCLQLFVVAQSASGKGAIAHTRQLAEPLHEERVRKYPLAKAQYLIDNKNWREKLKQDIATPEPQQPAQELFIIPGNNTGTGILQNIIDSGGNGLIFEVEADTVSTAIHGDYGHWSDTLRKAFDHEELSYNRRTDREYKSLKCIRLSVVISGTPQQIEPMIPSAENGLFSRQIFYYIGKGKEWINQLDEDDDDDDMMTYTEDNVTFFDNLTSQFMGIRKLIIDRGVIELKLNKEQRIAFNAFFNTHFKEGQLAFGGELDSTVIRQGINAVRIMSIIAVLREFEKFNGGHLKPTARTALTPDGTHLSVWRLEILDDDFNFVLSMIDKLYYHSIHTLSFLKGSQTERRKLSEKVLLLKEMPDTFTRQQWNDKAKEIGIVQDSAKKYRLRLLTDKLIVMDKNVKDLYHKTIKGKNAV